MEFARNLCSKSCKQVLMQGCSQIMNNTIKRDNIWVMQIRKDRCFIPEVHQYADKHNKKTKIRKYEKRTIFSCSDGFPAKHLSLIIFIAASVPLYLPLYTVPKVPEPVEGHCSL